MALLATQVEPSVRREARGSGLRRLRSPSLEAVQRRRFELWTLALVVCVMATLVVALVSFWPATRLPGPPLWAVRASVVALALAFCTYVAEKEFHLRRLTRVIVDQRVESETLAARLGELRRLAEVGSRINSTLVLQEIPGMILSAALELLEVKDGSLMLVDGLDHLKAVAVRGSDVALGARTPVGWGVRGRVAQTREPVLIAHDAPDVGEADHFRTALEAAGSPSSRRGVLCVPLLSRSELLGVVTVHALGRSFTEYELGEMTLFAEYAGLALANANLYEAQCRRAADLTEANRMKSRFVTMLSYEMRTPVESMLSVATALRGANIDGALRQELLESNEEQGDRLLRVIDELLASAQMDRTAAHPDRPIDLGPLVVGVVRDLEMPTGDMIPGTIQVAVQDGCVVVADPVVLQHVLVSLVDNAQRHGALPVKVEIERDGERVILSVIDAGPGIRPADRERVFERFSRSNGGGRGGMTLGLPIVRDLVSGLGGTVELGEGPEGGVAARVSLPGPGRFGSPA